MREPLPVDEVVPEVLARLGEGPALVLEAPAGAGKTTRVPPALLPVVPGEIVVLEPRRLAARAPRPRPDRKSTQLKSRHITNTNAAYCLINTKNFKKHKMSIASTKVHNVHTPYQP